MTDAPPPVQERSPRRGMCAAILSLEAVTLGLTVPVMVSISGVPLATALWVGLGLTTPVLISIADVDTSTALWVGLGLAVACFVLAGMLRGEWAYALGWLIQAVAIGLGFVIPMMFALGAIFAMLWGTAYFLGRKIERDRAAAYANGHQT